MSASLSVSIVTFEPALDVLGDTLRTLAASLACARKLGSLSSASVTIVDNGPGEAYVQRLTELAKQELPPTLETRVVSGHGNLGYGLAHNLALHSSDAEYHLVLNPDVILGRDAISEALRYMEGNPDVVIVAPQARDPAGEPLYLCKRYPSVLDLLLRGFAPQTIKRWFNARLERYEMRDLPRDAPAKGIPIVSGSFMFCRRTSVAAIGGFSRMFFLYFEDFDLSLRAAANGVLAWVPSVQITHRGGNAARKGWRHVRLFARSAVAFFNRHGWKWA
jgi:GT2 family glycosyltransferase